MKPSANKSSDSIPTDLDETDESTALKLRVADDGDAVKNLDHLELETNFLIFSDSLTDDDDAPLSLL